MPEQQHKTQQTILMGHMEDDLPMNSKQTCQRCHRDCWLGPRLTELLETAGRTGFDIMCQECAILTSREAGGAHVAHLGNPLS